jgi:2-polyprenyl-3-methyl-5-hydroxy-6-metoxy-1,4-benzoquinol methylase
LEHFKELIVVDHSVSGEEFTLKYDKEFEMYKTYPQPSSEDLLRYYVSKDYISHTSSKRNLIERLYHMVRSYMLRSKLRILAKYSEPKGSLLDIGCGTGDFLMAADKKGWNVVGVEPNHHAREKASSKGLEVYDIDRLLKFADATFDVITLWHVLEHLPNLEDHIKLFKKLLRPGGLLVIAVPNYKSFDAMHYGEFWAAFDIPRHLWHFSKLSIESLFLRYNLILFLIKPMWFDSFYVSILSEKYKKSNFGFIKGVMIGFISNLKGLHSRNFSSQIYLLRPKI